MRGEVASMSGREDAANLDQDVHCFQGPFPSEDGDDSEETDYSKYVGGACAIRQEGSARAVKLSREG